MNTIKTLTVNGKQYALIDDWARERLAQESMRVDDLAGACPIVCQSYGQALCVEDSANYPITALRLYGKTLQEDTPAPDAPVALIPIAKASAVGVAVAGTELFAGWQPDAIPPADVLPLLDTVKPVGRVGCYLSGSVKDPTNIDTVSFVGSPEDSYLVILRVAKNAAGMAVNKTTFRLQKLTLVHKQTRAKIFFRFSGMANEDGSVADIAAGYSAADGSWVYENNYKANLKAEPDLLRWKSGSALEGDCFVAFRLKGIPAGCYQVQFGVVSGGAGAAADVYVLPGDAPRPIVVSTVATPNGLPGIPVAAGGNYIDENGQRWLSDVLDLTRGVYVQNVVRVVFNKYGNITLSEAAQTPATNVRFDFVSQSVTGIRQQDFLCNYGIAAQTENSSGVWFDSANGYFEGHLSVDGSIAATVEELKALLAVTPIEFLVPLAEPVEKKLPEAFAYLHSYRPVTLVCNNAGAGMELVYTADTKSYIDNRLEGLERVEDFDGSYTLTEVGSV